LYIAESAPKSRVEELGNSIPERGEGKTQALGEGKIQELLKGFDVLS
jgi:hypothetical protein